MTKKETGKFLDELAALYPNVIRKDSDLKLMLSMWDEALKDYQYDEIHKALQEYFRSDTRGYVPTAGQLIELTIPFTDPFLPKDHIDYGLG